MKVKCSNISLTVSHSGRWKFNITPGDPELSKVLKKKLLLNMIYYIFCK